MDTVLWSWSREEKVAPAPALHSYELYLKLNCSVVEPEPVEPKLFETWSRNYLFNKNTYLLQSVWTLEDARMKKNLHWDIFLMVGTR